MRFGAILSWLMGSAAPIVAVVGAILLTTIVIQQVRLANQRAEFAFLIVQEQKKSSDTQKGWDDYKILIEQQIANDARQAASDLQKALDERDALNLANEKLRQQYARVARERDQASAQLVKALNDAQLEDVNQLGPAVRDYLDGVRRQQDAARISGDPSAGNRSACERLPDGGFRCAVLPLRAARAD